MFPDIFWSTSYLAYVKRKVLPTPKKGWGEITPWVFNVTFEDGQQYVCCEGELLVKSYVTIRCCPSGKFSSVPRWKVQWMKLDLRCGVTSVKLLAEPSTTPPTRFWQRGPCHKSMMSQLGFTGWALRMRSNWTQLNVELLNFPLKTILKGLMTAQLIKSGFLHESFVGCFLTKSIFWRS